MENRWNLGMLFPDEEEWAKALESLPERNQRVRALFPKVFSEKSAEELLVLGSIPLTSEERQQVTEKLPFIFEGLKEVAMRSSRCEIWLARLTDIYPLDPHLAELSDRVDRITLHENETLRRLQILIRQLPGILSYAEKTKELQEYVPVIRKILCTPIAGETLNDELGSGWFRLNRMMAETSVDTPWGICDFDTFMDICSMYDWEKEDPETAEIVWKYYECYGEAAGKLLLKEVGRDEKDVAAIGERSHDVFLRGDGMSPETEMAVLQAVDAAKPLMWEARSILLDYRQWRIQKEEAAAEAPVGDPESAVCEFPEDEELDPEFSYDPEEELSDEEIDARNLEIYQELRQEMLERFRSFDPVYTDTIAQSFDGDWIWFDDDPQAYAKQSCARIYGSEHSYIHMPVDLDYGGLAHELGHAWNNRILADENILIWKNSFLVEFPSLLAETWERIRALEELPEQLKSMEEELGAEHPILSLYRDTPMVYEDVIRQIFVNVFLASSEYLFEKELRSRITRETITVEELSLIYRKYKADLLPPKERDAPRNPMGWVKDQNLFDIRQFYNMPYTVSMLLAMKCIIRFRNTEEEARDAFWTGLRKMIHEMNKRPTDEVLQEYFGGEPRDISFWNEGFSLLTDLLVQMRAVHVLAES